MARGDDGGRFWWTEVGTHAVHMYHNDCEDPLANPKMGSGAPCFRHS